HGLQHIFAGHSALHHQIAGMDEAHFIGGAIDGFSSFWDEQAYKNRARRVDDYPEGRRQDPLLNIGQVNRKFNLVAANHGWRFIYDAEAEVACMAEILDMLKGMEKHEITSLRIDPEKPVYDTLKAVTHSLRAEAGLIRFAIPLRKMA